MKYLVDKDNERKTYSEARLRKKLRKNEFTGLELIRPEAGSQWQPLHETEMFRQEVAFKGSSKDEARMRLVRGFYGHLSIFAVVSLILIIVGAWQFTIPIWAVFMGLHGIKVLPTALELHNEGKLLPGVARDARKVIDEHTEPTSTEEKTEWTLPPTVEASKPEAARGFEAEVARVKALLERRGGSDASTLIPTVDKIARHVVETLDMEHDLEEQTSEREVAEIEAQLEDARQHLSGTTNAGDMRIFQRQISTLEGRQQGIEQAKATLRRLRARRSMAEQEIKQLRLELSRAEASVSTGLSDQASRLEDLRMEMEARVEVEESVYTKS